MSPDNWSFTCPQCNAEGIALADARSSCGRCGLILDKTNGVWRYLSDERLDAFKPFLRTYIKVRIAEGRGRYDTKTLRALPTCPPSQPLAGQWRIRARSFSSLMDLLGKHLPPPAKVLDLGAGTGWLSNRLHSAGYRPCAIDLSDDKEDGLGRAQHFDSSWPCLQAEFDRLPIADGNADAVIFNASFHYCTNRRQTIAEALRALSPGGLLIILDSPIYSDASSGEQMMLEQQVYFEQLIGERSDSLPTTGYMTWEQLAEIASRLGLSWRFKRSWYGFRWAFRPWLAKLRGTREPAKFVITWCRKQ